MNAPTEPPGFEPTLFSNSSALQPVMVQGQLTLETPVNGSIDDDHPAVVYTFEGTAGMRLDALLSSLSGDLDPFLLVLDPKGREVARNDDIDDEQRNSAIHIITLAESGTYAFVATRFGQQFGETTGDFELIIGESSRDPVGIFSTPTGYEFEHQRDAGRRDAGSDLYVPRHRRRCDHHSDDDDRRQP